MPEASRITLVHDNPASDLYTRSKKRDEFFLVTEWFSRQAAYPIALLCRRLGLSANFVTILGGSAWVLSVPLIVIAGSQLSKGGPLGLPIQSSPAQDALGWPLALIAAALWSIGYILDVADGSLARMNGTQGPAGAYLDYYFHLLFQPMFFASIGVFLYLATSNMLYLGLGLLTIGGNWPVSHSAREHTLCEQLAKGRLATDALDANQRHQLFVDTPQTKNGQAAALPKRSQLRRLLQELVFFPGQFTLMGAVLLLDFGLSFRFGNALIATQTMFSLVGSAMVISIPFRMQREYRRMKMAERLMNPPQ